MPVGDKALFQQSFNTFSLVSQRQINEACGRGLWLQLTDATFLEVPMRQTDNEYFHLLSRVAAGKGTRSDYNQLNSRLICNPKVSKETKFNSAQIVVHTNALRTKINRHLLLSNAQNGHKIFCIIAKDTHSKYRLSKHTLQELNALPDNKTRGLPGNCMLQQGGKVHLTTNIAVELGLTNGSEGIVENIILSDESEYSVETNTIHLKHFPKCVLVRFENADFTLSNLPRGVVPVSPVEMTFKFGRRLDGKYISWTIHRTQLPLISSNCITSHKAQGKDISPVIVDLCPPKGMSIDSSFAYVMLSRCKSLQDLAILRPFPFKVLTTSPSNDLMKEERRLRILSSETHKKYLNSTDFSVEFN